MKPIYKSLALEAMTLQVSLALGAQTYDGENTSETALPAEVLDSLRVELVAQNVSGARNLIESGECVIDGSNLTITLDTSEWTRGAMYRVQVLATFGTQTQVIYALDVTVPYYEALASEPQEYEDAVTVVSTITDVTEADLEGLALEETSQEIKAAITPISQAAEAYNVGKTQLAQAITSKGVETSPTESYPEMAEKVNAISQETYQINGGEMYTKQLFGSLETPNYWNLYDVLAQLLSDGRLVNYGGILLAEYYRGYDSLALSGAGAGGAYVVSDLDENEQFKMYTEDTTHTWTTEFDGKGNRWVAYCFADENHPFQITDTNTSPRSIFIGRKVGTITSIVNGRCSNVIIPDGNKLKEFTSNNTSQEWVKSVVIRNLENLNTQTITGTTFESVYVECDDAIKTTDVAFVKGQNANTVIIKSKGEIRGGTIVNSHALRTLIIESPYITMKGGDNYNALIAKDPSAAGVDYFIKCEFLEPTATSFMFAGLINSINLYYFTNDKTQSIVFGYTGNGDFPIILQDGWCKPLNIQRAQGLQKENVQTYIFDRLGVNDLSTGTVTITLASAVLALFTQEEIDEVVERTNITIVGA